MSFMKSLITIIVLLANSPSGFSQNTIPHSFKITYVNCSIETVFAIPCNLFDSAFSGEKIYKQISASEILKQGVYLKKFVKIKSNNIDVRGKIEYIMNARTYTYCFDCSGTFTDGINYYKNNLLFKFLKKKCKELDH